MMKRHNLSLRTWQKNCVSKALKVYQTGQQNFMCVAAPGAGKTRFSASLAKNLLHTEYIDFILCFAPSVSVQTSIQETFSIVLNDRFDGRLGAKGLVITYQGIQYAYQELAHVIKNYRVLIISDEIHHCASGVSSTSNQWGQLLVSLISEGSPLTLTLSGTPWRSDSTKIALQSYSGEPQELHTDFVYGLGDAVRDKVCRRPSLILLDNSSIGVQENSETYKFSSIRQAIEAEKLKYSELLTHQESLSQLMTYAHDELVRIREKYPNAAGLVVASSIEQARRISLFIISNFNESAIVVSYDQIDAHENIRDFQGSESDWIVSIGMVSEGTDIPRLQVCAYLSNVRTELYFRQVLGRILRINKNPEEPCSMIAFAEPKLIEYSERINQDLPEDSMRIKVIEEQALMKKTALNQDTQGPEKNDFAIMKTIQSSHSHSFDRLHDIASEASYSVKMAFCKDSYRTTILSL
ncbi:DEAD/DEAH box helicase [Marinomonas transparens]|uniref:DEAD/DEAH box helicase family protein n=1 Tax=Marinomonas transparens TaxID=2795388 RepID=A0A934JZD6_9GAMM|nr:DEAD/DEAH box helicase family protein [Marinomonas transparens]MBJ7539914.1 DEAD/DEAH box helicase family protein [Marinomonas transparens]